jgi:hypothetical protein
MDPNGWLVAPDLLIGPTMSKLAVFALVLAATTTAHAGNPMEDGWIFGGDDATEAEPTTTAAQPGPAEDRAGDAARRFDASTAEPKSEATATAISLVGTLAGGAILAASWNTDSGALLLAGTGALMLGPSAGHWYAGKALTWGLPIRIAGAGLTAMGTYQAIGCVIAEDDDDCSAPEMVIGGLVLVGVGAVLDIATAGHSAREYNERRWQVTPTLVSDGQSQGMGLGVGGAF